MSEKMKTFACTGGREEGTEKEMYTSNHDKKVKFAKLQST